MATGDGSGTVVTVPPAASAGRLGPTTVAGPDEAEPDDPPVPPEVWGTTIGWAHMAPIGHGGDPGMVVEGLQPGAGAQPSDGLDVDV